MKIKAPQLIIAALIILGITFLVIGVFHQREPIKYFAHSLRTWQEADSVADRDTVVEEDRGQLVAAVVELLVGDPEVAVDGRDRRG